MSEPQVQGNDGLQAGEMAPESTPAQPILRPGVHLGAQRQALGLTIEQVANQLNLAPRQIQALEDDNHAALPGMVIVRGFIRAYAKLLKIDPAPLVAMVTDAPAPTETIELRRALAATFSESSLPAARRAGRKSGWILIALVLLALGATGWFVQQQAGLTGLFAWMNGQLFSDQQSQLTVPAQQQDGIAEQGEPAAVGSTDAPEAAAIEQAPPPQAAPADSKAANPNANLILKIREDSWVEIRRADQVTLIARLVKAGTTESFEVRQPVELVVGNATGVEATFQGKPLDLTASAKSNVARLNLQ